MITLHSISPTEHRNGFPCGSHHQNEDHAQEEYPKVGFKKLEEGRTRYLRE